MLPHGYATADVNACGLHTSAERHGPFGKLCRILGEPKHRGNRLRACQSALERDPVWACLGDQARFLKRQLSLPNRERWDSFKALKSPRRNTAKAKRDDRSPSQAEAAPTPKPEDVPPTISEDAATKSDVSNGKTEDVPTQKSEDASPDGRLSRS